MSINILRRINGLQNTCCYLKHQYQMAAGDAAVQSENNKHKVAAFCQQRAAKCIQRAFQQRLFCAICLSMHLKTEMCTWSGTCGHQFCMMCSRDLMHQSTTACPLCREPCRSRFMRWHRPVSGELDASAVTREEIMELYFQRRQEHEALRQMRRSQHQSAHDDIIDLLVQRARYGQLNTRNALWQQHQSDRCGLIKALLACMQRIILPPRQNGVMRA